MYSPRALQAGRAMNARRWSTGHSRSSIRDHDFSLSDYYLGKSLVRRVQHVLAKTPVGQAAYKIAPTYGKIMSVVAPVGGAVVGTIVGSPTAGAAAGSVVGTGIAYGTAHGGAKGKRAAAQKAAKIGLAVTAATGIASATGLLSQAAAKAPAMPGDTAAQEWDPARGEYVSPAPAAESGGPGWLSQAGKRILDVGERRLDRQGPAVPGSDVSTTEGATTIETSGGGGSGGGGAGPAKRGDTQNLIMVGVAALGVLFLLKNR